MKNPIIDDVLPRHMNLVERVEHLIFQQEKLVQQLKRSLAIQSVCPHAFEYGRVETFVVGNPYHPEKMLWCVQRTRPDGEQETIEFPIRHMPEILFTDFIEHHPFSNDPAHSKVLANEIRLYYQEHSDGDYTVTSKGP